MKIRIRQHDDASTPQEDGWSQMGDWLAELGDDDHTKPSGDGHAEPDGTDDSRLEAPAQAGTYAEAPAETAMTQAAGMTQAAPMTQAAGTTANPETRPDLVPVTPGPASAKPQMLPQRNRPRPLEVARCSMCGITLPLALMVPDGGQACTDIRWYCKDAMSCTTRWTTAHTPEHAHMAADPDDAFAGAREAAPDEALTERMGSVSEAV